VIHGDLMLLMPIGLLKTGPSHPSHLSVIPSEARNLSWELCGPVANVGCVGV
jgi:hypothetical protein